MKPMLSSVNHCGKDGGGERVRPGSSADRPPRASQLQSTWSTMHSSERFRVQGSSWPLHPIQSDEECLPEFRVEG